jgi:thiol:disulfide interchange protein DsbD
MRRPSEFFARVLRFFICPFLAFCILSFTSPAVTGVQVPRGTLNILAENSWIVPGSDFTLGFHFKLEKGWHIYWVNPGDSGEPPRVTWQLPQGISAGDVEWPVPHRLGTPTVVDFGYGDEVLLLVKMHAASNLPAAQPAKVDAGVRFLICREMCIPGKAQLSLTLPVRTQAPAGTDTAVQAIFSASRARLPRRAPANWKFVVNETRDSFVLRILAGNRDFAALPSGEVFFFPLVESQIENAAPQKYSHGAGGGRLTMRKSNLLTKPIRRLKGVLVLSENAAYIVDAPIEHTGASERKKDPGMTAVNSFWEGEQK